MSSQLSDSDHTVRRDSAGLLSSGTRRKIDEACAQFQKGWTRNRSQSIVDQLSRFPDSKRPLVFARLLRLELKLQKDDGQAPEVAEYVKQFSDFSQIVREVFDQFGRAEASTHATQGLAPDTFAVPDIGDCIDRFEIRGFLGKGGFGTVFRAYDPKLDRDVAIKIPRADYWLPEEQERRLDEARAGALLTHPNVCPIYEVGETDGRPFIVMAWIDGRPLSRLIAKETLSEENAIMLVRQVALTMEEAHRSGQIHRDLKPANIMIDTRGNPILTDFGLASRGQPTRGNEDDARVGTLAYMSPEQVRGDTVGPASDIYSLGVVFYELLTGRRPFTGEREIVLDNIQNTQPEPPSVYRPNINWHTQSVCLKALRKDPQNRYQSMHEMAKALDKLLLHSNPVELLSHVDNATLKLHQQDPSPDTTEKSKERPTRRKVISLMFLMAAVLASIWAGSHLFPRDERLVVESRSKEAELQDAETGSQGEESLSPPAEMDVRDVAKWLAGIGAPFEIMVQDQAILIKRPDEIPEQPFQIIRIDLTGRSYLSDEQLVRLSGLNKLQSLVIRETPLTDAGLVHLQSLATLQLLWVDRTNVSDEGLVHLQNLHQLQSLSLNDNAVTGRGLRYLAGHPNLQRLSLKRTPVDDDGLNGIRDLKALTHLWLDATRVTDAGLESLAALENLTELMMSDTEIDGSGLKHLAGLPSLEQLTVKRTHINDVKMELSDGFAALTHLYLDETRLANEGLANVTRIAPGLVRLSIGRTRVGTNGLQNLLELANLEMLTLDHLRVSRRSVEMLGSLPKLKSLSLRATRVGDGHVPELSQLTDLQELFLESTQVTRNGRQRLAEALPNCEIHY